MSNKHILLKIVELIYIFLKIDNQKAIMKNIFINCEFAKVLLFNNNYNLK